MHHFLRGSSFVDEDQTWEPRAEPVPETSPGLAPEMEAPTRAGGGAIFEGMYDAPGTAQSAQKPVDPVIAAMSTPDNAYAAAGGFVRDFLGRSESNDPAKIDAMASDPAVLQRHMSSYMALKAKLEAAGADTPTLQDLMRSPLPYHAAMKRYLQEFEDWKRSPAGSAPGSGPPAPSWR